MPHSPRPAAGLGAGDETRQEFGEVVEGGVPGLPEPHGAVVPELPLRNVEKFPSALGYAVQRITEEKRRNQGRVGFVFFAEGGHRVAEQVLHLRDPTAVHRTARSSCVIGGELLQPRGHQRLLIVRADIEAFDSSLAASTEFFG